MATVQLIVERKREESKERSQNLVTKSESIETQAKIDDREPTTIKTDVKIESGLGEQIWRHKIVDKSSNGKRGDPVGKEK